MRTSAEVEGSMSQRRGDGDDRYDADHRLLWAPVQEEPAGRLGRAKRWTRNNLRRLGYDVQRHRPQRESYERRRARVMRQMGVDLVLDVGANVGQYGLDVRREGFRGRIVSFEPLETAYSQLVTHAAADPCWECQKLALGDAPGTAVIHVAANSASSSLLPMARLHEEMFPESVYVAEEQVSVARLDDAASGTLGGEERVMLKLDVQGFELAVLKGADEFLDRAVCVIEAELSTQELYAGQPLWRDVVEFVAEKGFRLVIMQEALVDDDSGHILQLNAVFVRD